MRHQKLGWVLAALALTGWAQPAAARWMRADTQDFVIYSEGSEKSLHQFAENLQRFDTTLRNQFKVSNDPEPYRLVIYLVQHAEDAGRLATGKGGSSIAGFYSATTDYSFAVSNRDDDGQRGTPELQQTLFHEYAHHFMKRHVPIAFPAWFIEGFAEYYSTTDFTKEGNAAVGKPVNRRAYGLLAMPKVPAEKLLSKRPDAMRNSGEIDVYYGRAWVLTHLLYNDPTRNAQLLTYLTAINNGGDPEKAAIDAFGDLEQLDKDLNNYIRKPLNYRITEAPIALSGTIKIASLSDADDALIPLQLERLSARGDMEWLAKVRDKLKKDSGAYPASANIWFELAAAEWDLGEEGRDEVAARAYIDKALMLDPKLVRANVLLGRMREYDLDQKGDYSAEAWANVRKPIALANHTNPDDPVPLYAYFQSFIHQHAKPPEIALQGLARAFSLAPENINMRVTYAFALANQGRYDDAIKLAKTVAFDPHDDGNGQMLLSQIEQLRNHGEAHGSKNGQDEVTGDDEPVSDSNE